MLRRNFIVALGAAAALSPHCAIAQQGQTMSTVGYLESSEERANLSTRKAFHDALNEQGYFERRNVNIEFHWADNQYNRLPILAADLVRRNVAVIFATSSNSALAVKAATTTVPIVFRTGGDPVSLGLVQSFNQPGANLTGVSLFSGELVAKRLEIIRGLVPNANLIGFLTNPNGRLSDGNVTEFRSAARKFGQEVIVLAARTEREIDDAFATAAEKRVSALVVDVDIFFGRRRSQVVALAARYKIPTSYPDRQYSDIGGLMSYGNDIPEGWHQAGLLVASILKGTKPSDLAVMRPTKFEFVINLKTATTLGLKVPRILMLAATDVISQ